MTYLEDVTAVDLIITQFEPSSTSIEKITSCFDFDRDIFGYMERLLMLVSGWFDEIS